MNQPSSARPPTATIRHALDVPLNAPQNNSGISRPIITGKPILELFG